MTCGTCGSSTDKSLCDQCKNKLSTPRKIYYEMCLFWGLDPFIDVCASEINHLAPTWIEELQDGLKTDWNYNPFKRTVAFCNPPHDKSQEFFLRAIQQAKEKDVITIFLFPLNSVGTKYYLDNSKYCLEKKLTRIKFLDHLTLKESKFNSRNSYVCLLIAKENVGINTVLDLELNYHLDKLKEKIKEKNYS